MSNPSKALKIFMGSTHDVDSGDWAGATVVRCVLNTLEDDIIRVRSLHRA